MGKRRDGENLKNRGMREKIREAIPPEKRKIPDLTNHQLFIILWRQRGEGVFREGNNLYANLGGWDSER